MAEALAAARVLGGRWAESRWLRIGTILLAIAGVASAFATPYLIDLDVYRTGAQVFLSGASLYGPMPPLAGGVTLPFTYPPIAAHLFVAFALVPLPVASVLLTSASVAALGWTLWVVFDRRVEVALPAFAVALWLEPVRQTLQFGQINLLLMALVVTDLIAWRGRRRVGLALGLAIAVKLTPAVFLALLVVRRDGRALLTALASLAGFTALGFVLSPRDSLTYWTTTIRDPSRIGDLFFAGNVSVNGELHRLGLDGLTLTVAWLVVAGFVALALLWLAAALTRVGQHASATMVVAAVALVASPVSWSHHWVWAAVWLPVLTRCFVETGRRRWLALAAAGWVVFLAGPQWWVPNRSGLERSWTPWQHLVGSAYLEWVLAALVLGALWGVGGRGAEPRARA